MEITYYNLYLHVYKLGATRMLRIPFRVDDFTLVLQRLPLIDALGFTVFYD